MAQKIFLNLPVADLERSKRFYEAIGFAIEPRFSDETAAAIVVSETITVMLLTPVKFAEFAPLPTADASEATGFLLALSLESRAAVDTLVQRAVDAGGKTDWNAPHDHGFMYGHVWEPMWMDETAMAGVDTTRA